MNKKIIIGLVVFLGLGAGAAFGVRAWRAAVVLHQEQRAYKKARELLQADRAADAFTIVAAEEKPDSPLDWPALEVAALAGIRDLPRLSAIYEKTPGRVLANEEASVLVARGFVSSRRPVDFTRVRSTWRGHERQPALWLILDSDALLLQGKPREAEKLLRSQTLAGKADADRLTRLALIVGGRDMDQAWQLINRASQLDPRNPDIRSFRAQILEAAGHPGEARVDYVAAVLAQTNNPVLRDDLAEFYRRQGNYDLALQTWREAIALPTYDYLWLKAAFWGKLIQPVPLAADKVAAGDLQPLAQWVISLPDNTYWNSNSFNDLTESRRYLTDRQELFWLQMIELLRTHHERDAYYLLKFNTFRSRSWQPDLEDALRRILSYRIDHALSPSEYSYVSATPAADRHQFFIALDQYGRAEAEGATTAPPADLQALLKGPDVFAAAFLAAGWREVALQLYSGGKPSAYPDWFAYGLGQDVRINRGNPAALDFLATSQATPDIELLQAEILMTTGKTQEALNQFAALASLNSPVGYRASYVLALADLDLKKYNDARAWVLRQPQLSKDVTGRELLARISLREGNPAEASRQYHALATESIEARVFLAHEAFDHKEWAEARRYTLELLQLLPDQLQLRENLNVIARAAAGK
jgi:tetratricopeptide (TPR) repeat protein